MSHFEQLLERIFTSLGWNEPIDEWIPPSASSSSASSTPATARRSLYTSADASSWGVEETSEDPTPGWRSFLHGLPATQPMGGSDPEMPPPNRRKRPALGGLTAFPTPRGLLVAQGRR